MPMPNHLLNHPPASRRRPIGVGLAIIILSFILRRVAPGGPFDGERPLAPEVRAALEEAYGLDKSLPEQVWMYLGRLALGDFGLGAMKGGVKASDLRHARLQRLQGVDRV